MMGKFDYDKHRGQEDYSDYLQPGPMKLEENAHYLGMWKHGERCGKGKQIWDDGSVYEGFWNKN